MLIPQPHRKGKGLAIAVLLLAGWCQALPPDHDGPGEPFIYETWRTFTTADGLPSNRILALCPVGDKLWVGTDQGLAVGGEQGRWESWTVKDGLSDPVVSAIALDHRTQDIWLGTWGGGLIRFTAGRFDRFDQFNSGLAGNLVNDVIVKGDVIWVATNGGVSAYHTLSDTWELYHERRADTPEVMVMDLALDPVTKSLYAAAWCGGVHRFEPAGEPGQRRWSIVVPDGGDHEGRGYAAHKSQRYRWIERLSGSFALPLDTTTAVAANDGSLWWVTQTHLKVEGRKVEGQNRWRTTKIISALPAFGEGGQTSRRADGVANLNTWSEGRRSRSTDFIRALAVRDGQAWIGTQNGLHVVVDGPEKIQMRYRRCAAGQKVEGRKVEGQPKGVVTVWRNDKMLADVPLSSALPDNRVRCVAFQGDKVWVGTAGGLALGADPRLLNVREGEPPGRSKVEGRKVEDRNVETRKHRTSRAKGNAKIIFAAPAQPVRIAGFRPLNKTVTLPGDATLSSRRSESVDLLGIELAIAQADRAGMAPALGPVELVQGTFGYQRYIWGTQEDDWPDFVYRDRALATVAWIAPHRMIATGAILHAEMPVMNVAPTAPTIDEQMNPWIFRCPRYDPRSHEEVLNYIFDVLGKTQVAIVRTPGKLTGYHLDLWRDSAHKRGHPPVVELLWDAADESMEAQLRALGRSGAEVVMTWCDAAAAGRLVKTIRAMGMDQLVIGGDPMVCERFVELAGTSPGAVIAVQLCKHPPALGGGAATIEDRQSPGQGRQSPLERFIKSYRAQRLSTRSPSGPDLGAFLSFEGTSHLLQAISSSQAAEWGDKRRSIIYQQREAVRAALCDLSTSCVLQLIDGRWRRVQAAPGSHGDPDSAHFSGP